MVRERSGPIAELYSATTTRGWTTSIACHRSLPAVHSRSPTVKKAAIVADPPAVNDLFAQPTRVKWKFAGCGQDRGRPTYLGRYCTIAITPTPPYVEGAAVAIEFYFIAYDDAFVINQVHHVD